MRQNETKRRYLVQEAKILEFTFLFWFALLYQTLNHNYASSSCLLIGHCQDEVLHLVYEKVCKKEKCRLEFWIKCFISEMREIFQNFTGSPIQLGEEVKKDERNVPNEREENFQIQEIISGCRVTCFLNVQIQIFAFFFLILVNPADMEVRLLLNQRHGGANWAQKMQLAHSAQFLPYYFAH